MPAEQELNLCSKLRNVLARNKLGERLHKESWEVSHDDLVFGRRVTSQTSKSGRTRR